MKRRRTKPLAARMHDNTSYGDGCWLWTGHLNQHGYGRMRMGGKPGRLYLAHRLAYELADCPIPEGMCVLHMCDTPACVRPTHLRLGTQLDNIKDMRTKGREARGEGSGRVKLSVDHVLEIRRLSKVYKQTDIAEMFGIGDPQVSFIVNRKSWKHI